EKIREKERKQPGSVPDIFSSHPPTKERVRRAQEEIARLLPAREEYVVTTSEFDQVKERLHLMMAGRRLEEEPSRPTLRRQERSQEEQEKEEDEPPVLRRRR
ncbi:MAG: peptidase M48, partial [Terriglobia bacterium]